MNHLKNKIKNFLATRRSDREVIAFHWKSDRDLIALTIFNRCLLLVMFFLLVNGIYLLLTLSIDEFINPTNILKSCMYFKYALFIYIFVLILYFCAEVHIIFYRG